MSRFYIRIKMDNRLMSLLNVDKYIEEIQRPIELWCLTNIGQPVMPNWQFTDSHRIYSADWKEIVIWRGMYVWNESDRVALMLRFGDHLDFS